MDYIVNCKTDYFSELYDRDVVFEVGSLSGSAQRILVPWIIMKLVLYNIRNPTQYLSNLLVFDEAQSQLWSRNLEMRGRQSFMATLATQARAFGLGLIVLAQNPATKLMTEIISNSCIKLCFHLGSGNEIYHMSQNMGLTKEQMDTFYHMDPGEAVCRLALGYTEPVKLDIFNVQDDRVSDLELNELMEHKWGKLLEGIEPAKQEKLQLSDKSKSSKSEKTSGRKQKSVSGKTVSSDESGTLSRDEMNYLRTHETHPYRTATERYAIVNDERVLIEYTVFCKIEIA